VSLFLMGDEGDHDRDSDRARCDWDEAVAPATWRAAWRRSVASNMESSGAEARSAERPLKARAARNVAGMLCRRSTHHDRGIRTTGRRCSISGGTTNLRHKCRINGGWISGVAV